jgi:hypothetical protein
VFSVSELVGGSPAKADGIRVSGCAEGVSQRAALRVARSGIDLVPGSNARFRERAEVQRPKSYFRYRPFPDTRQSNDKIAARNNMSAPTATLGLKQTSH